MALKTVQSGYYPLGQFDGLDGIATTVKGGEVVGLTYVDATATATDKTAFDQTTGYVYAASPAQTRPAVTTTLTATMRPVFLCDEGTKGYGTLYGQVVGGTAGQDLNGAQLGPHTATGSGKVTCWDKPGLYAVTLDAVDMTASTGLVIGNTSLTGGQPLYATGAGLLTPTLGSAGAFKGIVGNFISFEASGSLVSTSRSVAGATLGADKGMDRVLFHFNPTYA